MNCKKYAEDGNYFIKICSKFNLFYDPEKLIIYDSEKRGFGQRGLSANLRMMYRGNLKNIKEFKKLDIINYKFYFFLRIYYLIKYYRRILIKILRRN